MQHQDVHVRERSPYEDLYQRHAPGLLAYALRETASREDAEDIVLDVFLSIMQHQNFLTWSEQKQTAWLWAIARNKLVDRHRRMVRRPHASIEWLSEPLDDDLSQAPETAYLKQEAYTQLYERVHALPEHQQEVLRLRFGHGLRCREIAPVLKKSEGAVRMILLRALRTLRALYTEKEAENNV